MPHKNLHFDSKCVHSGMSEYEHKQVIPPNYQTSTFKLTSTGQGTILFEGKEERYIYTRMKNPTISF